ncbi:MAG: glycosyltransferase [Patescibacteria group bacterium]|nr:glycosyltransferase [Patescibacteria group bacterium]
MITLDDYRKIVGDEKIDEIIKEAKPLRGKYVVHINSTFYGGGVAEILDSLVYLMNQVEIKAGWRLIKGIPSFFDVTKSFHNGCQGANTKLTKKIKEIYEGTNFHNSTFMHLDKTDAVIIHDPQVLPLIKFYKKNQPWIWRCHIDITKPNKKLWHYLKDFINLYDEMIISDECYRKEDIKIPQTIIMPSINPLNERNKCVSKQKARKILSEHGIKFDKPIVSQISRFDIWKDPIGVVDSFKKTRKHFNCQLVLLGNFATDDPEGFKVYQKVLKKVKGEKDITVLLADSILIVNALQAVSEVVLQKSLREGFALTVSEALWKKTPVIGGNVGGIPNQIINGKNGYLVSNINECADRTTKLLKNDKLRKEMGEFGREFVREHFLITRHLLDYIKLLKRVMRIG